MKAFMSDPEHHNYRPAIAERLAKLKTMQWHCETEAKRIIGEAEPGPIELHRHVPIGHTAYPYEDEAMDALREALSTAISAGALDAPPAGAEIPE